MAAAAQLLACSLVLLPGLLPASPLPQPLRRERHARPPAAAASPGPGWAQELAGWPPLGSPSQEALGTRQALPVLSPLTLAAPGGSLVFSGAGEPDDQLWPGSSHAPLQSGAPAHSGPPPAPAGSSALPGPAWPLLLGADDSWQTLQLPPAGTQGAGGPGAGLDSGSWPFAPGPGSRAPLALAGALRSRDAPSGLEPWSLRPASPSPARPPGGESGPGPAGRGSPGTAGTPGPRPAVSTIALGARPGSPAGASSTAWGQAAEASPGAGGLAGRPVSQASAPQESGEPLEHAWGTGQASPQPYALPRWGHARGLPPHPTGQDSQPQPEPRWVPGARLAAGTAAAAQSQQRAGAGGSVAGQGPGLAPAVLSAGRLAHGDGAGALLPDLAALAPPAQGSRPPAQAEGPTLEAWTEGLSSYPRSSRRVLPGPATQPPRLPGNTAPGAEQGPEPPRAQPALHTTPGPSPLPGAAAEEEIGAPQRVRGAVDPKAPVNTTPTGTPAPRPPPPGTGHSDGTRSPGQGGTTAPVAPPRQPPATPRRGLIRVTTQRALQRPPLPEPGPSLPAPAPASSPPCPHARGSCSLLQPNQTRLRWADLQRALRLAWELHLYGASTLFLLLSLLCAASLAGSPALGLPHLPYTLGAQALLLAVGLLRATFLLADPYGARARLPAPALRLLYNAPFPLLLDAFALLLLLLLRLARLQLLPPPLQRLPPLAALATLQSALLLGADLLPPPLGPGLAVGLQLLSCACGAALLLASLAVCWQLRPPRPGRAPGGSQGWEEPGGELRGLGPGPGVLLGCSALGLPCCGSQAYGALWLGGVLGPPGEFSWSWWLVQFWSRLCELLVAFGLCFVASLPLCQRVGHGHTCWAKLVRYVCARRKAQAPEYPSAGHDWPNGAASQDPGKSRIRHPPEQVQLWALKDSTEGRGPGSSPSPLGRPAASPRRPHASTGCEGESVLSLGELEFRPPSPINLSRSIEAALGREHLGRPSLFPRASLPPARLARHDSCSSLQAGAALLPLAQPLLPPKARQRRGSDPDYLYSLARCSSLSALPSQSASLPPTEGTVSGSSLDSISRGSLKISWNPWRHGLASLESLPPEETPSRAPLLPEDPQPSPTGGPGDSEQEARRSFLVLSKQVDSRSLSSDTIEL